MRFKEDIFVLLVGCMHVVSSIVAAIRLSSKMRSHVACVPLLAPCVLDDP